MFKNIWLYLSNLPYPFLSCSVFLSALSCAPLSMNRAPEEGLSSLLRLPAKAAPSGQQFAPALQNASLAALDLPVWTAHILKLIEFAICFCIRNWKHGYCRLRRRNTSENLFCLFFFSDHISQLLLQVTAFLLESPVVLFPLLQLLVHLIQPLRETMTGRLIEGCVNIHNIYIYILRILLTIQNLATH